MPLFILCAIHFLLAVTSVRDKSNTYDEIAHLTRGYSYVLTGDFRLGPPHPPLAHYWAALPGLGTDVKFPPNLTPADQLGFWQRSDMWEIGRQFFYYRNLGNAQIIDSLLLRGRAMIALWSVVLGLLTWWWGRRLFGPVGGVIALGLYAFSPTMLAHARLVTTDMAAALFFMCSLTSIWWLLHEMRLMSVLASAASLACLFLAKMSAVLIIPVGVVLLVLRLIRGGALPLTWRGRRRELRSRLAQLGCFLAVMLFWIATVYIGIWAAYGFRYAAMVGADPQRDQLYSNLPVPVGRTLWEHVLRDSEKAPISPAFRSTINWLRDHRVFPEAYLYSAAYARQTARGRSAFLDGEVSLYGFRRFFPLTFLYKTPLPLMAMLLAAVAVVLLRARSSGETRAPAGTQAGDMPSLAWPWRVPTDTASTGMRSIRTLVYASAPLWAFFIIYWYSSIGSNLNIGHRHIMPTYPMLFVLCGATAYLWGSNRARARAVPAVLGGLFMVASLAIYPNYLAYFNWIAGGPQGGYRHLVDSSLDWGQDLPGLREYLDERRTAGHGGDVYVSYFGSGGTPALRHFGIEAKTLPQPWPRDAVGDLHYQPGLYAISATNLQQVYSGHHDWSDDNELTYQRLLVEFEACMGADNSTAVRSRWATDSMRRQMEHLQTLMFARLCAHLRTREPDDMINYTILVHDLDRDELDVALRRPVATP